MINNNEKDLIYLPNISISIPVSQSTAAVIGHMMKHNIGNFKISLNDLRADGANLIVSSHIRLYPAWEEDNLYDEDLMDDKIIQLEEDKLKHLKEFWNKYTREKEEEMGVAKGLSKEEIKRQQQEKDGIYKYLDDDWLYNDDYNLWIEEEILEED